MDQMTRLYVPAHFVKKINVRYGSIPIFSAETDISISENPSFRFYFTPQNDAAVELHAEVLDSKGQRFTKTTLLKPTSN